MFFRGDHVKHAALLMCASNLVQHSELGARTNNSGRPYAASRPATEIRIAAPADHARLALHAQMQPAVIVGRSVMENHSLSLEILRIKLIVTPFSDGRNLFYMRSSRGFDF
jgi:hypothetical protein